MPEPALQHATRCPVCDGAPRVLVAIRHPGMRHLTADLPAREYHCWVASDLRAEILGCVHDPCPPDRPAA